ncbi:MAG: glycoside hydrolase family 9 protein, partial [Spirochaetales bacterium]|nr:glycoside hydrolase family 9 protein [Spirochaetales bacterium]
MRKIIRVALLFVLLIIASTGFAYNYAEAMQKAIYFYECQQSGRLPAWNRVEWRGDSCLNDDVTGGWYDAGDHVKFGLPMAQAASTLGWAAYEYKDGIVAAGQWEAFENNLRFVLDYFVSCHRGNQFVYQVGDGGQDHGYWGPVEVIEEIMDRPAYTCNASCVTAGTAAALAIGSILFNDGSYLSHAEQLFQIADTIRSDDSYTAANGYYQSWSGFYDELMWAAVWLFIATGDITYLQKAEGYVPELNKQGYQETDPIEYQWGHCWDDQHYAAMIILARETGKQEYYDFVNMHLDWWTAGYDGNRITYTPGGLAFCDSWGSLRHAANTAFLAFVYSEFVGDAERRSRYYDFAEQMIDYCLGDNPRNSSYVVGFGSNPPKRPHHRNAHSSFYGLINDPDYHRHNLYGALVGGPNESDGYTDAIDDYVCNEVACDYNAGFVACLAKMVETYGGSPISGFPPLEEREPEMFAEVCYNNSYGTYSEIRMNMNNRSGWPPRVSDSLSARYYVDLTEVFDSGYALSDISVRMNSSDASISGLYHVSGNVYYAEIDFSTTKIYPGSMQSYYKSAQFSIGLASGVGTPDDWDPSNDYSYREMTTSFAISAYIPVYDDGVVVYGSGPGDTPTNPPATVPPTQTNPPATPTT